MYVPSDIVMLRPDGQAKLAFGLDASDEGKNELLPVDIAQGFCLREQRTRHGTCRVDDGFEMRVIIVVHV